MLNIELRSIDNEPIKEKIPFSRNIQIDVCITNFIKKLPTELFTLDKINYIYYQKHKIDRLKFFKDYNIENGDTIIVSEYELFIKRKTVKRETIKNTFVIEGIDNLDTQKPIIYPEKKIETIVYKKEIQKEDKNIYIFLLILSLLIVALLLGIALWLLLREKQKPPNELIHSENLIVDLIYSVNETMFYINKRINNSTMVFNQRLENQQTETFTNFSITISKEYEIDNKTCYSAYLVILNMVTSNENGSQIDASFDIFSSSSSKKNLRYIDEDVIDLTSKNLNDININDYLDTSKFTEEQMEDLVSSFKALPLVKFDFYRNGKIKDIFLPKHLKSNIFYNIYDLIDKAIPKISTELYQLDYETWKNETSEEDIDENGDEDEEEFDEEYEEEFEGEDIETNDNDKTIRRRLNNKEPYRGIENNADHVKLLEIDKSSANSGKDMNFEGSKVDNNIERKYNSNLHKIENINYKGETTLVNKLSNEEQYNELLEQKTQSNILENGLKEMKVTTDTSIDFIKNITDGKIVAMLDDVFSKIEIIRYDESEYGNSTLRILNSIPYNNVTVKKRSENTIWNKVHLYKNKNIAKKKILELRKLNPQLFKMEYSYAYNIFKTNIFGLKLQFQVVESINVKKGEITINFILTIGELDFIYPFKSFDTGISKIIDSSQLMTKQLRDLLIESNNGIINSNKKNSQLIIQNEKDIRDFIRSPYDFSNLYRKPYNDLYDSIKNFTTDTFLDLINTIIVCHDNYSAILNQVKKGEDVSINEIREVIQNQYFFFINEMTDNLEKFYNQSIEYLKDIESLITENFQIDILFDINDKIIKAKKIFTKFVNLLFNSIEKGMSYFEYDLQEYIENLIGDLLKNSLFIADSLNENEILKNAIPQNERDIIIIKLKNFKNIVKEITEYLYTKINNDYETNFNNGNNNNNIKISVTKKVNQIKEKFENESSYLIGKIKKLIKYIEYYELYTSNLDKIDNINNKIQNEMYNDTCENILELINKNDIDIKYNIKSLDKKTQEIVDYLKEDILDINQYISSYFQKYKKENKYKMLSNMSKIHKHFHSNEMKQLVNDYYKLIIKAIDQKVQETVVDNYNKGIAYVKIVYQKLCEKRFKDAKGVASRFLKIIPKFMTNNAKLLTKILSDFPNLAKKHFVKIKQDIFDYFEEKLKKIKKYYLGDEIYRNFIDLYIKEINDIKDNIRYYFNDDVFSTELSVNITNYTNIKVIKFDTDKNNEYQKYYKKIMRLQDYPISKNYDWYWRWIIDFGLFTIRRTFKRKVKEYYQLNKLTSDLKSIDDYLEKQRLKFVKTFTQKFEDNINNFVNLGKTPYINLNNYIEEKLFNNSVLINYINDYNMIIDNDKKNNFLLFSSIMNHINDKLIVYFKNIESNINLINNDYLCNTYYKDYESFLHYPNEVNIRLSYVVNEFSAFSKKIKEEINQIYNNKILNHIELIKNYSIVYMKNNIKYIQTEIYPEKIFNEYFDVKFDILNSSIDNISLGNENNCDNDNFKEIEYDVNNNLIIEKLSKSIDDIEAIIEGNFTNYTYRITDYSKYNFDISKLRTSIYYSRNVVDLINNLNIKFKLDEKNLINKFNVTNGFHFDDIINKSLDKLENINEKSYNELSDYFNYFKDVLDPYITNDNDYNNNLQQLSQILNNSLIITENYIEKYEKEIKANLDDLNKTLNKEFIKLKNEGAYNYNFSYYNNVFNQYINNVKNNFKEKLNNSFKFGYNFVFTNSFLDEVESLHYSKILKFKQLIREFQKSYCINFFNFTLDLGEYTEEYMKELHETHFNFTYDYANILEDFLDNVVYIEILNRIKELNETTIDKLYFIFNNYISLLNQSKSDYIQKDYIKQLYYNRSECTNYTLEHLEDEDQIIYLNDTNCTFLNDSLLNETFNSSNITFDICPFFNKTEFILYCNSSNYFNQKEFYYENITNEKDLFELVEKLEKTLDLNFNEIILSELLYNNTIESYKNNLSLDNYSTDISKDIFEYELSDFEIASEILSYNDQIEYKDFLNKILIEVFNDSIVEFINTFIIKETENSINIDVLKKYNMILNLLEIKLKNEMDYYLYLLKNSNEIGITTKKAFLDLYNEISQEVSNIIKELNDEFYYNMDYFYMKNKRIFIDDYYRGLKKTKPYKIFKLQEYIDKFFSNQQFNSTLEDIIKTNIYINFIESLKNKVNNSLTNEISILNKNIIELNKTLYNQLSKVNISDTIPDMIPIINITDEYNNLIDNQSNSFIFNINEQPFELFYNFTKEKLEPPLLEIKTKYDKIQDELLIQIFQKIDNLPDFYAFIVEEYQAENITSNVLNITLDTEDIFNNYTKNIINESINYRQKFNNLRRLYVNNKYKYLKKKLLYSNNRSTIKNGSKNERKEMFNKNKNERKLNNDIDGDLCFTDIEKALLLINNSMGNFSILYLGKDFRYLNSTLITFNNKIALYLKKLENQLSIITLRMSTLLTEEKLEELKIKLYREINLIKEYINSYTETITLRIQDYMNLLCNESISMFNDTGIIIANNVEKLYDDLLIYIMSNFETKSFKFTQEDLKDQDDLDLSSYVTDDENLKNISNKLDEYGLTVNFDAEEYLNSRGLDTFLDKIDEFINHDEAPIDIRIIFPIFFIPFVARFRLEYGFEIGIKIYTESHNLVTEYYGEAHATSSVTAGIYLGVVEFGGGLRGLLGYGRIGMEPYINFKYLMTKIRYYVKLATLKFQVFAYLELLLPKIVWISIRFLFFKIRIPLIVLELTRFEIGSQWTKGLQQYLSFEKDL